MRVANLLSIIRWLLSLGCGQIQVQVKELFSTGCDKGEGVSRPKMKNCYMVVSIIDQTWIVLGDFERVLQK